MSGSLIGKQLGDYTLVSVLATGGMARIYEGVDKRLGRQVAVKVLELTPDENWEDEALPLRFQKEARAVAQLEHDNIITIYQYGEQDGLYFIAMKLVRGRDLAQELARLRRNGLRMEVSRALRIMEQVASALDCAHEAQIIHRDVKPSNILLDSSDRATLTDFGLVMQAFDNTLGTAFGTPRYIAPEQALNSGSAVAQSDTYALAVILYEVLTGQTPFDGSTPMEIALSHINDPVPPPRSLNDTIPEAAEREILKALEKEPMNRHATASDFIAAVKRAYDPAGAHSSTTEMSSKTTVLPDFMPSSLSTKPQQKPRASIPLPFSLPSSLSSLKRFVPRNRLLLLVPVAGVALIFLALVLLVIATRPSDEDVTPTIPIVSVPTSASPDPPTAPVETAVEAAQVSPTETPIPPTTPPLPPERGVLLTYVDTSFSLVNISGGELDARTLQFVRGSESFAGSSIPRGTLASGGCFRLQLQREQSNLPPECTTLASAVTLPNTDHFFWRSEVDGSPSFDVYYEGTVIATCATIARGGAATCSFSLPPAA